MYMFLFICTVIRDHSAKNSYIIRLGRVLSVLRTQLHEGGIAEQGTDFGLIQIQYPEPL